MVRKARAFLLEHSLDDSGRAAVTRSEDGKREVGPTETSRNVLFDGVKPCAAEAADFGLLRAFSRRANRERHQVVEVSSREMLQLGAGELLGVLNNFDVVLEKA